MEVEIGWACPGWASTHTSSRHPPLLYTNTSHIRLERVYICGSYRGKRIPCRNCFALVAISSGGIQGFPQWGFEVRFPLASKNTRLSRSEANERVRYKKPAERESKITREDGEREGGKLGWRVRARDVD